ncbi:MAG: GNAT family N-acetyltransferase [Verrucomicrobiales bacterium]
MEFRTDVKHTPAQLADVLRRSGLAERRPVDDPECLAGMVRGADLMVTAWEEGVLVGVARSVTDFVYCCYLSDLAVDRAFQGRGIGRALIAQTQACLGSRCSIILLAAPAAVDYYPHIGMEAHPSAWVLRPGAPLR